MGIAKTISETILGQDVSFEEAEVLSQAVSERKLEKGEVLFEPDTKDETLYILVSGKLEILKVLGGDKTVHITTIKDGNMIGELSFIDGKEHTMRVVAKKDSCVLMLKKDAFEELVVKEPIMTYHVMRSILRYTHTLQRDINAKYLEMHRMVQNQYTANY